MERLEKKIIELDPIIRAVVALFKPFAEAAIYDLEGGRIALIYNAFSKRKAGDPFSLKELGVQGGILPDYFPPHYKMNHEGGILKCTLIPLKDSEGALIGLLSFAVDATIAKGLFSTLSQFLGVEKEALPLPREEGEGFEEKAKAIIEDFYKERGNPSKHLSRNDKKELIKYLHKRGIFNYKKAPFELSQWLKVSRASIYNYIKS